MYELSYVRRGVVHTKPKVFNLKFVYVKSFLETNICYRWLVFSSYVLPLNVRRRSANAPP